MAILGMILGIVGWLAMVVGFIMVLIVAFKDDTTQGLLTLFVPFYVIYYLFAKYTKENKKTVMILIFGGIALGIVGGIIGFASAASQMGSM